MPRAQPHAQWPQQPGSEPGDSMTRVCDRCRALILCEEIGLWGTAHTDGTVELRLLPSGAPDERYTLEMEPGKPVPSVNIPQFRAPFCVCPLSCPQKFEQPCLKGDACFILSNPPCCAFRKLPKEQDRMAPNVCCSGSACPQGVPEVARAACRRTGGAWCMRWARAPPW